MIHKPHGEGLRGWGRGGLTPRGIRGLFPTPKKPPGTGKWEWGRGGEGWGGGAGPPAWGMAGNGREGTPGQRELGISVSHPAPAPAGVSGLTWAHLG